MNDLYKTWFSEKKRILLVASVFLAICVLLLIGLFAGKGYFLTENIVIAGLYGFLAVLIILGLLILVGYKEKQVFSMRRRIDELDQNVMEADKRLEIIFKVNQDFLDSTDENEVIKFILKVLLNLVNARNVSFIPIDEHGYPHSVLSAGEILNTDLDKWLEILANPEVKDYCVSCNNFDRLSIHEGCPLAEHPISSTCNLLCYPLRRGKRDFGIINIFIDKSMKLDDRTQAFIRALMEETSAGLESVQFRRRELDALRQIHFLKQKSELSNLLQNMLENAHKIMNSDFWILRILKSEEYSSNMQLTIGHNSSETESYLNKIFNDVTRAREPIIFEDNKVENNSPLYMNSILAAPLLSQQEEELGVLLVSGPYVNSYRQLQISILQTIAGQIALVLQNAQLIAEIEYKTMIQERTRLAREIHDSLAQTLGFLKLQTAQIRNNLDRGDIDAARSGIDRSYKTLSETYKDARQSIDGLRVSAAAEGGMDWLEDVADNFLDVSGIKVDVKNTEFVKNIPPEIHAQLIRIVQEALSNIRKHGNAQHVWLSCVESSENLLLEIKDDGVGFSPEDVSTPTQYGLRGMRERAELIGADFQIESRTGGGTMVKVSVPLSVLEYKEVNS